MNYRVRWEIDVEADSPELAAWEALHIQRDPNSIATVFTVLGPNGIHEIDLGGIITEGRDLSDLGPYATGDDKQIASERGVTIEDVRKERALEDLPEGGNDLPQ